jgi:hypothetical protein
LELAQSLGKVIDQIAHALEKRSEFVSGGACSRTLLTPARSTLAAACALLARSSALLARARPLPSPAREPLA